MSHFTVLVIGSDIDGALAPFQENNMGDCPRQYLEFNDTEGEMLEEYETGTATRVVMPDGSYKSPYDEVFRKKDETCFTGSTHEVPAEFERREVPFKELYATFEQFVAEYHGTEERDPEKNRYGYWENPNRKWDWYQVGGRWTGYFKLKPGAYGETGRPGLMTARAKAGYADSCRVGDIDVEAMRAEAQASAAAQYDAFHAVLAGRELPDFEKLLAEHGNDASEARKAYWGHPVIKELQASREFSPFEYETYATTDRETYLRRARDGAISTFAVLKDGAWYERGSMGWWGRVADEADADTWNAQFSAFFDSLPPDTVVSVVDCHI